MTPEYFKTLYGYNSWANELILRTAEQVSAEQFTARTLYSMGNLRGTLVHILSAEWIWLSRWNGVSPQAMLREEELPTLAALRARWRDEEAKLRAFVAKLTDADLRRVVAYKNTRGEPLAFPLWQLMAHVVNHGTQHRAEAAAMLTDLGHSPGNIDLVIYLAEQESKK
jgi:uncharacterized damage-inducible protein DinB